MHGILQQIEKPARPWEVFNLDFVTGLPMPGDLSDNLALVFVCTPSRKAKFIPVYKDIYARVVALFWWKHM